MALTQVRAKIGEEWLTLTLNEATGRYEAQTTAQGTSYHQPGGYWAGEAQATDEAGETVTVTADKMAGLRFVVREETAPTLTLVSPAPGYLLSQAVTLVFEATDETGGSGVDPDSFSLEGATAEVIPNGYRFTWSGTWTDGPHTVTASVNDYDGNVSTVSGAYLVDTVPPELYLQKPYQRHVTDAESVLVSGVVLDTTSGVGAVTVDGAAVPVASGRFEKEVPLDVGENTIPITVTDQAGNTTTGSVYMIRLITDRAQTDIDAIKALREIPVALWTDEQKAAWDYAVRRGSTDYWTLNRVGITVYFLSEVLKQHGYSVDVDPKKDYTKNDYPTESEWRKYLADVAEVATAQKVPVTELPATLNNPTLDKFNRVEKALVDADALFPKYFAWTAGELTAGGY